MFSHPYQTEINKLFYRELNHRNAIIKNPRKSSEFRYANYTFADSFKMKIFPVN